MMTVRAMLGAAVLTVVSFGASAAEQPVSAANAMAIARSNACMGCHAVDRKLVGPSFQQIADKYKGDAQAPAKLAAKVKNGGSGVWGSIPMPSHPRMNDADIKTVVAWVLTGAQQK
ncbi:Cytochrome c551/c552 [Candidatus Burkholderia verschuerenii]|uniref:Cytochrome c551/c552 n=1 Tax=Candidatus Burkholderia verschuerenii TaxID=242163 RepID=A0A0L0M3F2_9BURK|nr:c-type cytochrome [Candidatus Burkholderia verschuerenii]KND57162.1 Cytochrome c551/c552 [Candidatus Burkholderia verschuerenii]